MSEPAGLSTVVLLGAPRSGTTWLQQVLAAHEEIVSPQETKVVHEYIAPALRAWGRQPLTDPGAWRATRYTGLAAVLTEERFLSWLRALVEAVSAELVRAKPSARVLVLKDPPDCRHVRALDQVLRPAAYIHLIRDGRDVTASLMRIGRSWGAGWAPRGALLATRVWRTHVAGAREARHLAPYLEVRYEALRAEPTKTIAEILEFIGVDADRELIAALLERATTAREGEGASRALSDCLTWTGEVAARGIAVHEPDGFVGDGGGSWRRWPAWRRRLVEWDSGLLLAELGYLERPPRWAGLGHGVYERSVERALAALVRAASSTVAG